MRNYVFISDEIERIDGIILSSIIISHVFLALDSSFIHGTEYSGYSARVNVSQGGSKLLRDICNFS